MTKSQTTSWEEEKSDIFLHLVFLQDWKECDRRRLTKYWRGRNNQHGRHQLFLKNHYFKHRHPVNHSRKCKKKYHCMFNVCVLQMLMYVLETVQYSGALMKVTVHFVIQFTLLLKRSKNIFFESIRHVIRLWSNTVYSSRSYNAHWSCSNYQYKKISSPKW